METIIAAAVTGLITLTGTIITVLATSRKTEQSIKVNQAVMGTRLDELTREVREHNNFARRMPVVENDIGTIKDRLDRLETKSDNNTGG